MYTDSSNTGSPAVTSAPTLSPASIFNSTQISFVPQFPTHSESTPRQPPPTIATHPMITRAKAGIFKPKTYLAAIQDLEPSSVKTALQDSRWFLAMKEEFEALQRNQTWSLVPSETAGKVVGKKWVFRLKYNPDGSISEYKACSVANGYHQTHISSKNKIVITKV